MPSTSMENYVAWVAGLLLLGSLLAGVGGVWALSGARRLPYFQLRRQTLVRGWQLVLASLGMLLFSGLVFAFGQPAAELIVPPTPLRPPSATPSPVPATATITPTPSISPTASRTPTASITPTPSDTPTPTVSPTPALPPLTITLPATLTVTPPPNAVAADMRFSLRDNCSVPRGATFFDQVPKTIYAHFYYDGWLPGVLWSGAWYRDGELIHLETRVWDGSTGGCGFSDYDNDKLWWQTGTYEVQLFIGERWLLSSRFEILRDTPTPTATSTRTPRTPTLTFTPTPTRTPRTPTLTPTPTRTSTPRPTATP